jgi:hypothetical protein
MGLLLDKRWLKDVFVDALPQKIASGSVSCSGVLW